MKTGDWGQQPKCTLGILVILAWDRLHVVTKEYVSNVGRAELILE